jgi:Cation efflux family
VLLDGGRGGGSAGTASLLPRARAKAPLRKALARGCEDGRRGPVGHARVRLRDATRPRAGRLAALRAPRRSGRRREFAAGHARGALAALEEGLGLWRGHGGAQVLVAAQFFILAPFITYEGVDKLVSGGDIETSWLGIGLTIATLAICQPLGLAKRRLGAKLGCSATVGEGTQNLLCGYLAIAVLVGLLANTLFGVWWLDPLIALGIAAVAVQEGRKALRGEGCGCASC